ncbi:MAG: ABC transporter substrate-binding protein [Pseudomonadota bacterium]
MATITPRLLSGAFLGSAMAISMSVTATAQDLTPVTYLLPAPQFLVAFAPMNLADSRGYYADEGVEVEFITVRGGAEVATQIGAGNALVGGGIGDTSIIVRPNGVPVRSVGILGGGALTTVVARGDRDIDDLADLEGKTIAVQSFQDTTFYSLLGAMGTEGLGQSDADIQAHGPAGVWQLFVAGEVDAMSAVPDWIYLADSQGVDVVTLSSTDSFPSMAQAVIASDEGLAEQPDAVCGVVRAISRAVQDIMDDPESAATDFIAYMEANEFPVQPDSVLPIMQSYAASVYPGQDTLGMADPDRIETVQNFYLDAGIIRTATPVDELYTNECIQ